MHIEKIELMESHLTVVRADHNVLDHDVLNKEYESVV